MEVLDAATSGLNLILAIPLPPPTSTSILVDRGEDILIARWAADAKTSAAVPILLWDDSISSTIIFQVSAKQISSAVLAEKLVDGLINWSDPRLASAGLCVMQTSGPGLSLVGYGYRNVSFPMQWDEPRRASFYGWINGATGYLSVTVLSQAVFPDGMKQIDERFPPLAQRVSALPTSRLMASIGHALHAKYLPDGQYKRDDVLIHELISRKDFAVPAFEDLLFRGAGNHPSMAGDVLPELVRAAIDAHELARFAPSIHRYLDKHPPYPSSYGQADYILSALRKEEEIDLEARAIEYMQNGLAFRSSLEYLRDHGRTQRAFDAVAALDPDGRWGRERKAAIAAITERMNRQ